MNPVGRYCESEKCDIELFWSRRCEQYEKTTLDILRAFVQAGGKVVFAGEVPELIDAVPSSDVQRFAAGKTIEATVGSVIASVQDQVRRINFISSEGQRISSLLYQLRKRWR